MGGLIVVISGPSGVGKDTVIHRWSELNPDVVRIVTHTTRAPKSHEVEGRDYHFETVASFQSKVDDGTFLEHEGFFDKRYASPREPLDDAVARGRIAVLNIDVNGALRVRSLRPAVLAFIAPPDLAELRRRLMERGRETPEEIAKRLDRVEYEMDMSRHFDRVIVNRHNEVDAAVGELENLIGR